MKLDSDKTFGELYSSPDALQAALTDLETRYKKAVSDTRIPLRFLTLLDDPRSEPLGNTIHLRLTRREDYNPSWTYVAVSYTWAQPEGLAAQFNIPDIKIWIDDTEARPPNCPPSILYRALQYDILEAKTGRLWIDQECIDQDDAADRDEHIAHMHKIYERSKCTAIVLSQAISASHATLLQRCIETDERDRMESSLNQEDSKDNDQEDEKASAARIALETVSIFSYDPEKSNNLERLLAKEDPIDSVLCAIFGRIVKDTYFTRAWTYQEQFCSKTSCYLIPVLLDSTSYESIGGKERIGIFMPCIFLQNVYQWCSRRFLQCCANPREQFTRSTITLSSLLVEYIRFSEYYPLERNAAGAAGDKTLILRETISGMRTRECKYVSDRVTIVANISGLENTLRTTELQNDGEASYSTCVLALLVMNQVYRRPLSWAMRSNINIAGAFPTFAYMFEISLLDLPDSSQLTFGMN